MYKYKFEPNKCLFKKTCSKECIPTCVRYMEMHYMLFYSSLPNKLRNPISLVMSNLDLKIFKKLDRLNMQEVVENGDNLYICSQNVGNGKTSWAGKLAQRYMAKVWIGNGFRKRVLFVHVPTLLANLKDFNNSNSGLKRDIEQLDLIVWDEIGIPLTEYDRTTLLGLIDFRINNEKSNIFTSNKATLEDLSECVGDRLASRIFNLSAIFEFRGSDKRGGLE